MKSEKELAEEFRLNFECLEKREVCIDDVIDDLCIAITADRKALVEECKLLAMREVVRAERKVPLDDREKVYAEGLHRASINIYSALSRQLLEEK